jgi:glycosyltransferase involved in cell wall biosynthesis
MPPFRAGFVMEQVLGHVSHYRTLRSAIDHNAGIDPQWIEVTYEGAGRLERSRWIPAPVRSTLRGFLQVREGLTRRPLDAVLYHTQKPAVFQWDLLARVPSVLSLDVTPRQYDELGTFYDHRPDADGPTAAFKHWLNRRTFALSRHVVVWSHWVKQSLIADYGLPSGKVSVIPPGVDLSLWTSPAERRNRLPRVLFVGGDFERKGGHLLLDWYRQQGRGRCTLDIVTRARLAPEDGVTIFNGIQGNTDQARQRFCEADVFILPSLGECFGIASVEAMAAGLPVVATNVGGAADIVDDGVTGYLIAPNDRRALDAALDRLVSDESTRTRMGRAGRRKAEAAFDGAANAVALVETLRAAAA